MTCTVTLRIIKFINPNETGAHTLIMSGDKKNNKAGRKYNIFNHLKNAKNIPKTAGVPAIPT